MATRSLTGCRGILTGASSGIGRALAIELVRGGAKLLVVARRGERLEELAAATAGLAGQLITHAGDITVPEVRQALVERAGTLLGGLDLLVNNAGIGALGPFLVATPERMRQVLEVNFFAAVELTRLALPALLMGNTPMIVNVGSILGHRGIPFCAEYCASKFALRGFSQSLRAEVAHLGVDVLLVSPGTTQTEFFTSSIDAQPTPWSGGGGLPAEVVARRVTKAICRGRHEIIPSASGWLLVWLNRFAPGLVDRIMARYH